MRRVCWVVSLSLTASVALVTPKAGNAQWPAEGRALCTAANEQTRPAMVSDGAGGGIVVWEDGRAGPVYVLYAQHVLASGMVDPAWPLNGRALTAASGGQASPAIVTDGAGGAIVAWYDYNNATTSPDIYAQHLLGSGTLDPDWPVDGRAVCTAPAEQYMQTMIPDGAGGAIVTWVDCRSGTGHDCANGISRDIYVHHILSTGALDPNWPGDGRALCTAVDEQSYPKIVSDGADGAIVTWTDYRSGLTFDTDVYAQHVLSSGVVDPAWPLDGRAVCAAANYQMSPAIVSDGAAGAIISWLDTRSGVYRVYAQRVLSTGELDPVWPVDGCALGSPGLAPLMVEDDAGGAIVAWESSGSGLPCVQRVLASGTIDPTWPIEGRVLGNTGGAPTIVADGAGGAIVVWYSGRPFAQHVLSSGAVDPGWPPFGRDACPAAEAYSAAEIISDGTGGAILAWQDMRDRTEDDYWEHDIYAQRVYASGEVTAVPSGGRSAPFSLRAPHPNPAYDGRTVIDLELPTTQRIQVEIFDLAGQRVRSLVEGQEFEAGVHSLVWEGRDGAGASVPAGIYLVRSRSGNEAATRKVAVLKGRGARR